MYRNKQLEKKQIEEVIKQYELDKQSGLNEAMRKGNFCDIVKTLHDPRLQLKYRRTKQYRKIDDNEIELITWKNQIINISYGKIKNRWYQASINSGVTYVAPLQNELLDKLKHIKARKRIT